MRAGAVLLALTLALAACSGGSSGGAQSTSAATTSVSATPTVAAPPVPVQEATPDSAVEFVKYFWALYNYAYATYDTQPLEKISDEQCSFCAELVKDMKRIAAEKTTIQGFELTVLEAVSPDIKIKTGTVVVSSLQQKTGTALGADGSSEALPGFKSVRSTVSLIWDGSWRIQGITNEPKTKKPWPAE